jgi:hypothetical protein
MPYGNSYSNGTALSILANAAAGQGTAKNLTTEGRRRNRKTSRKNYRKSRRSVGNGSNNKSNGDPTFFINNTRKNRKSRKTNRRN